MFQFISLIVKYRYLILVGGTVIGMGGAWLHGYFKGKENQRVQTIVKIVETDRKSKKGADDVRREVQSYNSHDLDLELCNLGVVRGNRGCD